VWLCMEVMDVPLDKFYRVLYRENRQIPENVLRKITVDVCVKSVYDYCDRQTIEDSEALGCNGRRASFTQNYFIRQYM